MKRQNGHANLSRRQFARSLGLGCALLPLVSVPGLAEDGSFPHRLLLVYHPNGCKREFWEPTGGETGFTVGDALEPLVPWLPRLTIIGDLTGHGADGSGKHPTTMANAWTGTHWREFGGTKWANGPSVDQVIAERIGSETSFRSLEFGVQTQNHQIRNRMIYTGPGEPKTPEDDPVAMFERVFADHLPSPELVRVRARRRSVLDRTGRELTALLDRVGAQDRAKLQLHLESIREVERRLDGTIACEAPAPDGSLDSTANGNFEATIDAQTRLVAQALACDLTRVASLQLSGSISRTRFQWLGLNNEHHFLMHGDSDAPEGEIYGWYAKKFSDLLATLDAIPEGDGTLLDHTTVVWGTDMAHGNHGVDWVPVVLAGGTYFRHGRYVRQDGRHRTSLLVSICHAMGLDDVTTFGEFGSGGPLPNLT